MRSMAIGLRFPKASQVLCLSRDFFANFLTRFVATVTIVTIQLDNLIAVAVESGRVTHNHPTGIYFIIIIITITLHVITGFLGAVAGALFTSVCPHAHDFCFRSSY